MRIMTVMGSPRRRGATARMLGWTEERLRDEGCQVDRATIVDYRLRGCVACMACKTGGIDLCAIEDDDGNRLLQRARDADLLVLASPVYCWGFTAQMKAFLDRMYCLVGDYRGAIDYESDMEGKAMGLLLTAGGGLEDNAELVLRGYENMTRFLKTRDAGHFFEPACAGPDELGEDARARAVDFADRLMEATRD